MSRIREVWASNLEVEMRNIRTLMEHYPYVAMDTEFPGVVARPIGAFKTSSDYHYQTMRCNVDLLKIIQVGLTLADEEGNYPEDVTTWQFNFRFNINEDMCAPDSIELLEQSGIDFDRHRDQGISQNDFAELMITSGLVLTDEARWISFHSGYDFGYFLKLLTGDSLPTSENEFFDLIHIWFPNIYDIKFMMRACKGLKGGLQDLADDLGVLRIGQSHQAGSDSLLTMATFFKMRELYFDDRIDHDEYNGKLYGLGQTFTLTNNVA
ncbi:ribonuclease CAF1, partial [Punctularia strigosozonata HHB-11173 SS5]|uniref:ribonuclease CAF1 n=1 Tax=Punctularia strigosozonata (strain HHB-11173) TaxID=741275 RepID=UPI00044175A7